VLLELCNSCIRNIAYVIFMRADTILVLKWNISNDEIIAIVKMTMDRVNATLISFVNYVLTKISKEGTIFHVK